MRIPARVGKASAPRTRVFLVGAPRSGTTLLQSMIASHGSVTSFPETHAFRLGIGRGPTRLTAFARRLGILRRIASDCRVTWSPSIRCRMRILLSWRVYVRTVVDVLDASTGEGAAWLEKTPDHLFFIAPLTRVVPDCKFVHIAREGGAVAASIVDMWNQYMSAWPRWRKGITAVNEARIAGLVWLRMRRQRDVTAPPLSQMLKHRRLVRAAAAWNESVGVTDSYIGNPNHFVCKYEDLAAQPREVLTRVCAFLGISYSDGMLAFGPSAEALTRPAEPWKRGTHGSLHPPDSSKLQQLEPDARAVLDAVLARSLSGGH